MGCLETYISRIGEGLKAHVSRTDESIQWSVSDVTKRIAMSVHEVTDRALMAIHDVTERLNAHVSIVCSLEDVKYLRVSPEEIQWITPEYGVAYTVESDTEWIVVVD